MNDYDNDMGEFHDLFMVERWRQLHAPLSQVFGGLSAEHRLLDLGAGTGLGTRALARVTAARITAVEPSLVQRAQLTARVIDDPDLVSRVTVLATPVPRALHDIMGPIDGFVAAHMLGHLDSTERRQTFAGLRQLLAPGGVGVITVESDVETRDEIADTHTEELRIGELTYSAKYAMLSDDEFVNIYSVARGDRILRTVEQRGFWKPLPTATLSAELASVGLALDVRERGVGIVTVA